MSAADAPGACGPPLAPARRAGQRCAGSGFCRALRSTPAPLRAPCAPKRAVPPHCTVPASASGCNSRVCGSPGPWLTARYQRASTTPMTTRPVMTTSTSRTRCVPSLRPTRSVCSGLPLGAARSAAVERDGFRQPPTPSWPVGPLAPSGRRGRSAMAWLGGVAVGCVGLAVLDWMEAQPGRPNRQANAPPAAAATPRALGRSVAAARAPLIRVATRRCQRRRGRFLC